MTTAAEYAEDAFKKRVHGGSEKLTPDRMIELAMQHELYEFDADVDGIMSTLVDVPVYELYPQAIRISGRDAVRTFYELTMPIVLQFDYRKKEVDTREIVCAAFSEYQVASEVNAEFEFPDGTTKRIHLMCVGEFSGDLMVGERLYCDHALAGLYDEVLGPGFYDLPGVTKL
jgi:hypothetical protein